MCLIKGDIVMCNIDNSFNIMSTINKEWKDCESDPFYNVDTFCDYLSQYYEYGDSYGHMVFNSKDGNTYNVKYKVATNRWLVTVRK